MNIKQTLTMPGRAATLPICFIAGKNPPIPIKRQKTIFEENFIESLKESFTSNNFLSLYKGAVSYDLNKAPAFEDICPYRYIIVGRGVLTPLYCLPPLFFPNFLWLNG